MDHSSASTKSAEGSSTRPPSAASSSPTQSNTNMCNAGNTTTSTRRRLRRNRGSESQFPGKLYDMLEYVEQNDLQSAISWVKGGKAFMVHDPEKLVEILPMFFGQTKYRSFRRQINMWNFHRILEGHDRGVFIHPFFVRDDKKMLSHMSRHTVAPPPPPNDVLDNPFRCEEWRIHSLRLQEPLTFGNRHDVAVMDRTPIHPQMMMSPVHCRRIESMWPSSSMYHYDMRDHKIQFYEPSSIILTESPILSSAENKLPGINLLDLKNGDLLTFTGRQFYFIDCQHEELEKKSMSDQRSSASSSISSQRSKSMMQPFVNDAPMIVADALLEPISPRTIETIFD